MATNAYFLGKHVLPVEKCTGFAWWGELMNRLIHRSWGENLGAIIYLTHHAKHLWISGDYVCQPIFLGIWRGKETFSALVTSCCGASSWDSGARTSERKGRYSMQT